jgi:hypothetical protein
MSFSFTNFTHCDCLLFLALSTWSSDAPPPPRPPSTYRPALRIHCLKTQHYVTLWQHYILPSRWIFVHSRACCIITVRKFLNLSIAWQVMHVFFFITKPSRCTNFHKFVLAWNSTSFVQFLCPSSGVYSLYIQQWYMSYRFFFNIIYLQHAPLHSVTLHA